MTIGKKFYDLGCRLSTIGANLAGHPLAIVPVALPHLSGRCLSRSTN